MTDFPAWFGASLYGGLACAVLAAIVIALWSLVRRRGLSSQVLAALLICLLASALDTAPIIWTQNRLGIYGPTLALGEVATALAFTALCGWVAPLGAMIWYVLFATPLDGPVVVGGKRRRAITPPLMNLARQRLAMPDGGAWGTLCPEPPDSWAGETPLRHELVLIGRDPLADLTLIDDRVSRYHAELRWEGGQAWLVDLDSLNGTRANRLAVVGRTLVRNGDILEFGSHRFRFASAVERAAGANPDTTVTPIDVETRKTAGMSGAFGAGGRPLAVEWTVAGEGHRWVLTAPITTIGRDTSCSIALSDDSVSRLHAQITRQPSGYFIVDVESSNGILHNGAPVEGPQRISVGDTLQLGDVRLTVRDATPPEAAIVSAAEAPSSAVANSPAMGAGASPTEANSPASPPATLSEADETRRA